jgi:uracil-DNA glycosylase
MQTWKKTFPTKNIDVTTLSLDQSWTNIIFTDDNTNDIDTINKCIKTAVKSKKAVYPYPELVFNAFNNTPFDKVKVIIIGQDPYHNSELVNNITIPQAMGMSFSVNKQLKIPSSLLNIYKNLVKYKHIKKTPSHGDLTDWAKQGVLLMNSSLTVIKNTPNCHQKYWSGITDNIIQYLSDNKNNLVFMLWGRHAINKSKYIDTTKHKIICSSHPSGYSYNKPMTNYDAFIETDHFGLTNKYLKRKGIKGIKWDIKE